MSVRQPNPTEAAGILRNYLLERGLDLSHTQALEAVAQINGYKSFQILAAHSKRREKSNLGRNTASNAKTDVPKHPNYTDAQLADIDTALHEKSKEGNIHFSEEGHFSHGTGWYWTYPLTLDQYEGKAVRRFHYNGPFSTRTEAAVELKKIIKSRAVDQIRSALYMASESNRCDSSALPGLQHRHAPRKRAPIRRFHLVQVAMEVLKQL